MDYKLELQNNNIDLSAILNTINALPEANSGIDTSDATAIANDIIEGKTAYVNGEKVTGTFTLDAEITTQEEKLSTQDTLIANMMAALESKAAGGNNTKTIYLDWSEDAELINEIVYLNAQGQFITVEAFENITSIEAEHGIVFVRNLDAGTWWTSGLKNTSFVLPSSSYLVLQTTQNGETIYLVSSGMQQ